MSKNQSIKSFFAPKQGNQQNKTKEEEEVDENKQKHRVVEKNVERKSSVSPKKEMAKEKKIAKSNKKKISSESESDEVSEIKIDEEKENKKVNKSFDSVKLAEKNQTDSSDFDDSPIKNKSMTKSATASSKKRKLVIESSDDDKQSGSDNEKNGKKEKTTKKSEGNKKSEKAEKISKKEETKEIDEIVQVEMEIKSEASKEKSPTKKPINSFFAKATEKKTVAKVEKKSPKKESPKKETPKKVSPKKSSPKKEKVEEIEVKTESTIEVKEATKETKSTINFFSNKKTTASLNAATSSSEYSPDKDNYHPINDACWEKDQSVPYKALAQTLYCMEKTTKRLELLSIVCNYFRSVLALTPKDLIPSIYLFTNKVAPDYENIELGIGDTVLFKALAEATGCTLAKLKVEFQNKGDIGLVAEANRCNQKLIFTPKKLTVLAVYNKLKEIAQISGNASQSKKCDLIKSLLVSCDSIEARYLMRSLAGKLRNGLGEQSILSSLAHACTITPPPNSSNNEKLVIDKLAKLRANDVDEMKKILEKSVQKVRQAYYQCPNYDRVIGAILNYGVDELDKHCKLTPGVPLRPMLAYPTKGIQEVLKRFDNIDFTCEYKYDGERAQIHIQEDGSIQIYSRNLESNTTKYPDIIEFLQEMLNLKSGKTNNKLTNKDDKTEALGNGEEETVKEENDGKLKVTSAIIDAEVVAYDIEKHIIQPFQKLSTRKRKDAVCEDIKVQVCLFAFDLLYLNGESLIDMSLRNRRDKLYKYFPKVDCKLLYAEKMDANDLDKIQEFLDNSIKDGCEGLMIKTLDEDAHYEISKRSHNWLKLKKDYLEGVGDTLDLVVIGGYLGTGKRTGVYGGYLLACYDPENEEYQTICKLGTGLKDNDLTTQFESLSKIKIDKPKSYYNVDDSLEQPDHWFEPEQVWEIKCADFSLSPIHRAALGLIESGKGISLRFPRFLRLRDDKKAEQATTGEQLSEMYKNQQQMINLVAGDKKDSDLEDEMD